MKSSEHISSVRQKPTIPEARFNDLLNEKSRVERMGNQFSLISVLSRYMVGNRESQLTGTKMAHSLQQHKRVAGYVLENQPLFQHTSVGKGYKVLYLVLLETVSVPILQELQVGAQLLPMFFCKAVLSGPICATWTVGSTGLDKSASNTNGLMWSFWKDTYKSWSHCWQKGWNLPGSVGLGRDLACQNLTLFLLIYPPVKSPISPLIVCLREKWRLLNNILALRVMGNYS